MKYQVYNLQSFFDVAIQLTGDSKNAFSIAVANELMLTDELTPGDIIEIPDTLIIDDKILKYYELKALQPATALTELEIDEVIGCEGIGCWIIENDFIIS